MAIKIDGNFVCIGGFCFCETPTGLEFSGEAQSTLFCDPRTFLASACGYVAGGATFPGNCGNCRMIQKFSLLSDSNAFQVGDLTNCITLTSGQSSETHGYNSGGYPGPNGNIIQKYPFTSDTNATDVGDLLSPETGVNGHTSVRTSEGFVSGGSNHEQIQKFPFASDTNSSDHAEMVQEVRDAAGVSHTTHGYTQGGYVIPARTNQITKFPFSTSTPATDIGDLTQTRSGAAGISGETHGYAAGGGSPGTTEFDTIDKFPFATDTNATNVGELTFCRILTQGVSSTTDGYTAGGANPAYGFGISNCGQYSIEKFPFASDTNATCIANLFEGVCGASSSQF